MILILHMIYSSNFTSLNQINNKITQPRSSTYFANSKKFSYCFNEKTNRGNDNNQSRKIIGPMNVISDSVSTDSALMNTIPYNSLRDNKAALPRENSIEKDKYLTFADNKNFYLSSFYNPTLNYKKSMEKQNIYPEVFENEDEEAKNSNKKMKICISKIILHDHLTEVEQNSSNENKNVEFFKRFGKILKRDYHILNNHSAKNISGFVSDNYSQNLYPIQKQRNLKCRSLGKLYEIFILLEQDFNNHQNRIGECADEVLFSRNANNVYFLWNSNFIDSGIAGDIFQSILSDLPTFKAISPKTLNSNHENLNTKSDIQLKYNMFLNNQEIQNLSPESTNNEPFFTSNPCFAKQKDNVSYDNQYSPNDEQISKNSNDNFDKNKEFLRASHLLYNNTNTRLQVALPKNRTGSSRSYYSTYNKNLSIEKNVTKERNEGVSDEIENPENTIHSKKYIDDIFGKINSQLRKKIPEIFNFRDYFSFIANKYIHQNSAKFDACLYIESIPFRTKRKHSASLGHLIREIDDIKTERTLEDADKKYETFFIQKNNSIYQEIEKSIHSFLKNKTKTLEKYIFIKNKIMRLLRNYEAFTKDNIANDEKLIVYSVWNSISSFIKKYSKDDIISSIFPEIKFINETFNDNLDKQQVLFRNWIPGRYLKIFVEHKFELFKEDFGKDMGLLDDPESAKRILDIRIFYIFDLLKFLNTKKTILGTYVLMSLKSYYLRICKQFNSAIEKIEFEKVFKTPHVFLIGIILKHVAEDGTIDYKNFEI